MDTIQPYPSLPDDCDFVSVDLETVPREWTRLYKNGYDFVQDASEHHFSTRTASLADIEHGSLYFSGADDLASSELVTFDQLSSDGSLPASYSSTASLDECSWTQLQNNCVDFPYVNVTGIDTSVSPQHESDSSSIYSMACSDDHRMYPEALWEDAATSPSLSQSFSSSGLMTPTEDAFDGASAFFPADERPLSSYRILPDSCNSASGAHREPLSARNRISRLHCRSLSRQHPYQDISPCTSPAASNGAPRRHSASSSSAARKLFCCEFQGCTGSFSRAADLDRHVVHMHTDNDQKRRFECDYDNCSRQAKPFHRKDHFRDHLRDQHREDITKRGSNAKPPALRRDLDSRRSSTHCARTTVLHRAPKQDDDDSDELAAQLGEFVDCRVDPAWWRCSRCLGRVKVDQHGWTCPGCKGSIENLRLQFRQSQHGVDTTGANAAVSYEVDEQGRYYRQAGNVYDEESVDGTYEADFK